MLESDALEIGKILADNDAFLQSNCVVFFECVNPPNILKRDSGGYYHTPYSFDTQSMAKQFLDSVASTCTKIYILTKGEPPNLNVSNIINYINVTTGEDVTIDALSFTDRDLLSISMLAHCSPIEKKLLVGTAMILNSKGYLGEGANFQRSAHNILDVIQA
jgi:hypothetical protein